jgi:hypothetical protein
MFLEYFPLITNSTCSKLDTNQKKHLHAENTQTLKMDSPCFFQCFFFLPNVHHSFFKLERILT